MLLKTRELAHYLVGKTKNLDFVSILYGIQRFDSLEIRQKIFKILYSNWKNLGFSKGILALHETKRQVNQSCAGAARSKLARYSTEINWYFIRFHLHSTNILKVTMYIITRAYPETQNCFS